MLILCGRHDPEGCHADVIRIDLRRIKRLINGFDEIYDIHLKSAPKVFIHNIPDHETDDDNGQINHYTKLFHIDSESVFNYLATIRASIEKLNRRIKTVITDCLMDTLIEAKSTAKIEPSKKRKK